MGQQFLEHGLWCLRNRKLTDPGGCVNASDREGVPIPLRIVTYLVTILWRL